MPVFISYSHANKVFVDLLTAHLIKKKARVWVDRWELKLSLEVNYAAGHEH